MIHISIHPDIKQCCPQLVLGCLQADIVIDTANALLGDYTEKTIAATNIDIEQIKNIEAIASSRQAYKAMGKDPARYRLSAEALLRRIGQGKGLYRINNVVDIINIVSFTSGYSIGGYNAHAISGNISLSFGLASDHYQAIGRGVLNIENLPVFRDDIGAFGSPTSDSERTMITDQTKQVLLVVLNFGNHRTLAHTLQHAHDLLKIYAQASNVEIWTV